MACRFASSSAICLSSCFFSSSASFCSRFCCSSANRICSCFFCSANFCSCCFFCSSASRSSFFFFAPLAHFDSFWFFLLGGRMRQRFARRGHAGVALDRLVVVGNRLCVLTLLFVSKAALVIGLRVLRVDLDGTIEIVDGLGVAVGTHQRRGAGAQRGGIFRLAVERGIVVGHGANRLACGLFDLCTVQQARDVVRLTRQHRIQIRECQTGI